MVFVVQGDETLVNSIQHVCDSCRRIERHDTPIYAAMTSFWMHDDSLSLKLWVQGNRTFGILVGEPVSQCWAMVAPTILLSRLLNVSSWSGCPRAG